MVKSVIIMLFHIPKDLSYLKFYNTPNISFIILILFVINLGKSSIFRTTNIENVLFVCLILLVLNFYKLSKQVYNTLQITTCLYFTCYKFIW